MTQDPDSHQPEPSQSQPGAPAGNYTEACQCDPPARITNLIDKGFIVDESLPGSRAREVASERLYDLAVENSDEAASRVLALERDGAETADLGMYL